MTTRADQRGELRERLNDPAGGSQVFSDTELNNFLKQGAQALYPTWYRTQVSTSTPGAGPLQTKPTANVRLHYIGLRRETQSTRVRPIRGWRDGTTQAFVPKLNIDVAGATLIWGWTEGWSYPSDDGTALEVPKEYEELVLLRAHISALERVLSSRVKKDKYLAVQVRQGVSEEDVALTLDALHATWREHVDRAVPLPELTQ